MYEICLGLAGCHTASLVILSSRLDFATGPVSFPPKKFRISEGMVPAVTARYTSKQANACARKVGPREWQ